MTELYTVIFASRNKDNQSIKNYKQRGMSFVIKQSEPTDRLVQEFHQFVNNGILGEYSRMYIAINGRDSALTQKELQHYMIDNEVDMVNIDALIARLVDRQPALTKHWLFDIDTPDHELAVQIADEITKSTPGTLHPTRTGYAFVAEHGFDTREFLADPRWAGVVELKRDSPLFRMGATRHL